jgi:hypothetical protein
MPLPSKIETQLYNFTNSKIVFEEEYNQYLFNEKWLIDVNENTFKESIRQILIDVNEYLKVGLQNKEFLKSLIAILDKKTEWFSENQILNIKHFDNFVSQIKTDNSDNIKSAPAEEKYSIEFLINSDEDIGLQLSDEENYYYDLWLFKNDFDNYKKPLDFEKVKLRYVMQLFYDSIILVFQYLDALLLDYDTINFPEYDYDKLLEDFDFQTETNTHIFNKKCHINLNKKDTAQLFAFLMETGSFSFHTDKRKNRAQLSKFIQANFTCKGDNDTRSIIKNINQEFTDLYHPNQSKQLPYVKELLHIVEVRISELK